MALLHICNANFEEELVQKKPISLVDAFTKHSVVFQLQFLPCLYAAKEDGYVATEKLPTQLAELLNKWKISPPQLYLFKSEDFSCFSQVESWGFSPSIATWAEKKGLSYPHPPWSIVKEVNSKLFSFLSSPKLPGAALLSNENEAEKWLQTQNHAFVLKTCFGVAGRGHLIQEKIDRTKIFSFLQKEWKEGHSVIAEPWVKRLFDFSTQWVISQTGTIEFLGATLCENDSKGQYQQSRVGKVSTLFRDFLSYLEEHRLIVLPILKDMAQRGYFGNVGIDAFVYTEKERAFLHPVVEINARKTMGWVALELQKRYFPNQMLAFSYSPTKGFAFNPYSR